MAQQPRKLVRITMIADHSIVYDVMILAEGKVVAGTLDIKPVKHAGHDEETGQLKRQPTGREFVLTFAAAHPTFTTRDIGDTAVNQGLQRTSMYSNLSTLVKEGVLKRNKAGDYSLRGKNAVKKSTAATKGQHKKTYKVKSGDPIIRKVKSAMKKPRKQHADGTVPVRVLNTLRGMQNGSGEGVSLANLREALGGMNVSPYLSDLVKKKLVTRVAPSMYRASEA